LVTATTTSRPMICLSWPKVLICQRTSPFDLCLTLRTTGVVPTFAKSRPGST
jgi:hypothetical protein